MHLVKQAQKPNVNRKERWEGEEEEGNSPVHIPVNQDKSLSSALKIIIFIIILVQMLIYFGLPWVIQRLSYCFLRALLI